MNPNSILGRYLSKQIILNFLGVLLMVLGVVFIFELIEMLRRAAGEDVGFLFVIQMAVTKLPQTIDMVFPFVMMIAAMITFWRLSKSNEFVIIRAAGVSIWGFLFPVLVTTFLIGIVNITVINPVSSKMYELYETMDYRFKTRNPNAVLFTDKGLWTREAVNKDTVLVIQARNLHQENNSLLLREVTIMEMDRNAQLIRRVEAFAATLDEAAVERDDLPVFRQAAAWLDAYFAKQPLPDLPPLAPRGSDFRQAVWRLLLEIPYGQVTTYGALAQILRDRGISAAAQAVGGAVGHNPISILIPCHRVVGADGSLTGYAGGVEKKRFLLALEGVDMTNLYMPKRGTAL